MTVTDLRSPPNGHSHASLPIVLSILANASIAFTNASSGATLSSMSPVRKVTAAPDASDDVNGTVHDDFIGGDQLDTLPQLDNVGNASDQKSLDQLRQRLGPLVVRSASNHTGKSLFRRQHHPVLSTSNQDMHGHGALLLGRPLDYNKVKRHVKDHSHGWPNLRSISDSSIAFCLILVLIAIWAAAFRSRGRDDVTAEAVQAAGLKPCRGEELQRLLVEAASDDQHHWSSGELLRLEARVVEGADSCSLRTPLTQRPCVMYSAGVAARTDSGTKPMAATQGTIDFEVSLLQAPDVRVHVAGDEVILFDLQDGRHAETLLFDAAPQHWQRFALRGATRESSPPRLANEELEFHERALLLGASVTLVGELVRGAGGEFRLRPKYEGDSAQASENWRTSWECSGLDPSPECGQRALGKVMVSDHPKFLLT